MDFSDLQRVGLNTIAVDPVEAFLEEIEEMTASLRAGVPAEIVLAPLAADEALRKAIYRTRPHPLAKKLRDEAVATVAMFAYAEESYPLADSVELIFAALGLYEDDSLLASFGVATRSNQRYFARTLYKAEQTYDRLVGGALRNYSEQLDLIAAFSRVRKDIQGVTGKAAVNLFLKQTDGERFDCFFSSISLELGGEAEFAREVGLKVAGINAEDPSWLHQLQLEERLAFAIQHPNPNSWRTRMIALVAASQWPDAVTDLIRDEPTIGRISPAAWNVAMAVWEERFPDMVKEATVPGLARLR